MSPERRKRRYNCPSGPVRGVPRAKSALEATLAIAIADAGLPKPYREYHFRALLEQRNPYRFDFAWPGAHLAVEVEGGLYVAGRHVRPGGFEDDCRKYNAALLSGWRVLRVTAAMIADGSAVALIRRGLGGEGEPDS